VGALCGGGGFEERELSPSLTKCASGKKRHQAVHHQGPFGVLSAAYIKCTLLLPPEQEVQVASSQEVASPQIIIITWEGLPIAHQHVCV
jgi:hypothetical protein